MADGVQITAGSGTTIATDDAGAAGQVQIVKLALSADGSASPVPATSDGLLVNLGANNDVTVSGTATIAGSVTANAGTNLNTSALALESGGNLAAAATSLAILDDWDESDRAKVNLIAGQAGITAGAGSVAASTPRVTLASDDPAVAALQLLDNAIAGNEMQVDIVSGTVSAAGTVGLLDQNSLANSNPLVVAIVDGAGDQLTSFGGGTQYTEGDVDATITGTVLMLEGAGNTIVAAPGTAADGLLVNLGSNNDVTVTGTIGALDQNSLANSNPLVVAIVDGAGDQITSFGGGTQYTEGDVDATITGTVLMLEGAGNTIVAAPGTAADGLLVNLGSNNDVTVSGTATITGSVTANAGTNLNTSALALETGGNLAGAATSLAIIDDWDETDRAKVNVIVGQAGITAGAGSVAANTPRVTHASDDPVVTALQIMDDWDETDRAKVNVIVGQAGITAGAGSVAANTPRVTLASDDPAVAALQIIDDWDNGASDGASVSGDVAHDIADAGEPVKIGARAIAHGANPTAVAAADRTNLYANRAGVLFVIGGHPNVVTLRANYSAAQTDVAIVTVAGGLKIVVTRISVTADKANTVDVQCRIGFATTNTPTTTGVVLSHPGIAAGSGVVEGNGAGILGVGGDGDDLRITCEAATSGSIDVVVTYYTIES